ncbi:nitrogen regulatory protein P-II homolog [Ziziphus jujuba]|uniref:Nitrogen regulatory protein P-II homolog n=1 Tax=Ziziphus jujuba TaxID=326968 RepID=A0ABM3I3N9_ZIZJJ|nr:nitrogen regulatory protein P-II homolog [Ziziphus jujuba]
MATVSKLGALTPLPYSNLKLKQQLPLLEFSSIIFKHSHLSLPNVTLKRLRNASPLPLIRAQSSADYFPDSKFYKVEAIVRPWRVQKVSSALLKMGIRGVTVSDVRGFGSQGGSTERQGGSEFSEDDFVGKVKMEIVVSKDQVEAVIDKIIDEARTGEIGDGKIFLVPVSDVIRVRTGERGEKAERMTGGLSDMFSNA